MVLLFPVCCPPLAQCNENISPSVLNRLIKEVKEYTKNPVSDIVLQVNEANVTDIRADLQGPGSAHTHASSYRLVPSGLTTRVGGVYAAETPYQGGVFRMKLLFGPDFPAAPPKGYFITPIFHPNVSKAGEICVNTLKKDWKSDCKLSHILMVVRCLLIEPNPESALNEEAGRLFMEDYDSYSQRARLLTSIHAIKEPEAGTSASPVEFSDGDAGTKSSGAPTSSKTSGKEDGPAADKKKMEKKRSLKRL